jgi:hypothetical protein
MRVRRRKRCKQLLDEFKEREDTVNFKRKQQMALCEEIALREAVEIS